MWRWLVAIVTFLAGLWFGNLAMANWWAAGGPPTAHRAAYEVRGNIFSVVALALLVLSIALVVWSARHRRRGERPDVEARGTPAQDVRPTDGGPQHGP